MLSASFIPVYAGLRARGDEAEARRVAGAVAALLGLVTAVLVLVGVLLTPWLIAVIAPGFTGEKREVTIRLVRILFPGAGLLVLSAWCLGVLNSHRRFFLQYAAPVALERRDHREPARVRRAAARRTRLAEIAAWGSVRGQPAAVRRAAAHRGAAARRHPAAARPRLGRRCARCSATSGRCSSAAAWCRSAPTSTPCSRACCRPAPSPALSYAQVLYTLPVSLFGMSVSAAELPAMSSALGRRGRAAALSPRRGSTPACARSPSSSCPSAMAFLALGDVVAGALFQSGAFTRAMTLYVWGILAGSAVGLLASTMGRLYASTYYALHDTRTPLRFAVLRVALTIGLGYLFALPLPRALGVDPRWGAAGPHRLGGHRGLGRVPAAPARAQRAASGATGLPAALAARLWGAAAAAAGAAWARRGRRCRSRHPSCRAVVLLSVYGVVYFLVTDRLGIPEAAGGDAPAPAAEPRRGPAGYRSARDS